MTASLARADPSPRAGEALHAPLGAAVVVDPVRDPRWRTLTAGRAGSVFASAPWIGSLSETYGFDPRAHIVLDATGTPVAGMAYVDLDDLRGRRLVSLPFCDHLDPIAADDDHWRAVVAPLLARAVPLTLRCLDNPVPARDARFTTTNVAAWHATRLDGTADEIVACLRPGVRQNARRAERSDVTVRFSDARHDVHAFHALHRHTRRHKYGMLAQPIAFFDALWERFSPTGSIAVGLAERDERIVAGALYLVWDGVFYYKFGASLQDALSVRPNDALAVASIAHAVERGCRLYDWGLSEYDQPGLVAYKRKLATIEGQITFLRWCPEGWCERAATDAGRLLARLGTLFANDGVPDATTQRASDLLYRYFA